MHGFSDYLFLFCFDRLQGKIKQFKQFSQIIDLLWNNVQF